MGSLLYTSAYFEDSDPFPIYTIGDPRDRDATSPQAHTSLRIRRLDIRPEDWLETALNDLELSF